MPKPGEFDYKIDLDKPLVLSVPSTGTHTIKKLTGIKRHWHFGPSDHDIKTFRGEAHIPIRNPFDVSITWEGRHQPYSEVWGLVELGQWDSFIEWYENNAYRAKVYKVEDLGIREFSRSDCPEKRDYDLAMKCNRIKQLRDWIPSRLPFFKNWYSDEELSWLTQ